MKLNIKQNKELRVKNYFRIINKTIIQPYIKNPKGDLFLGDLPINKLPKNLKYIDGNLNISRTNISELPDDITIKGSLFINYTKISVLPRELVINRNLFISYNNISELPDDIIIEGRLYCHYTPLGRKYSEEELRKKYYINGNIYGT